MKINPAESLHNRIALLEIKREQEWNELKDQYCDVMEHYNPVHLVKNALKGTFESVTHSPDIAGGLGKAAIGVASGFLIKKVLFGGAGNPIAKLAGMAVQTVATNFVAKNADGIKEGGSKVIDFFKKTFGHKNP